MIIGVILILVVLFLIFLKKIKNSLSGNKMDNRTVSQVYESSEGKFEIVGKRNKFKICKNNNIEFLVENGQIVACRDKRVSNDFKFYGGKKNGTV